LFQVLQGEIASFTSELQGPGAEAVVRQRKGSHISEEMDRRSKS